MCAEDCCAKRGSGDDADGAVAGAVERKRRVLIGDCLLEKWKRRGWIVGVFFQYWYDLGGNRMRNGVLQTLALGDVLFCCIYIYIYIHQLSFFSQVIIINNYLVLPYSSEYSYIHTLFTQFHYPHISFPFFLSS